jgi:hypothetical protein
MLAGVLTKEKKMKKRVYVYIACALLVAGCQHMKGEPRGGVEGFDPREFRAPNPFFPNVFITDLGNIVVDQEPIRIPKSHEPRVKITWSLAANSSYTFPDNGITIDEAQKKLFKFDCTIPSPRKIITCTFDRPPSGRPIKYTIRVRDPNKPIRDLDPTIMPE